MGATRLRSYAMADGWSEDQETTLRLFLRGNRPGLLKLAWNLMYLICRGDKGILGSPSDLRSQGHCDSCNICFYTNFDRAVEVNFRTSHRGRSVGDPTYCVWGRWNTPNVLLQHEASPGDTR